MGAGQSRYRIRLFAAGLALLGAAAVAVYFTIDGPAPESPVFVNEAARKDGRMILAAEFESRMADSPEHTVRSAVAAIEYLRESDHAGVLSAGRSRSLEETVRRRVGLYVNPEYEEYRRQIADWGTESLTGPHMYDDRAMWESVASEIAESPVDLSGVFARVRIAGGERVDFPSGSQSMHIDTINLYSDAGFHPESDVVDVYLPTEVRSPTTREPVRVYLVLSFVWRGSTRSWVPWCAAYFDPGQSAGALAAPWL